MCKDLVKILKGKIPSHLKGATTLEGVPISLAKEKPTTFLKTVFRGFLATKWDRLSDYFSCASESPETIAFRRSHVVRKFFGNGVRIHKCSRCGDLFFEVNMIGFPNKTLYPEKYQICYRHYTGVSRKPRELSGKQYFKNLAVINAVKKISERFLSKSKSNPENKNANNKLNLDVNTNQGLGMSSLSTEKLVSWLKKKRNSRSISISLHNYFGRDKALRFRICLKDNTKIISNGIGYNIQEALGRAFFNYTKKNVKSTEETRLVAKEKRLMEKIYYAEHKANTAKRLAKKAISEAAQHRTDLKKLLGSKFTKD